jgi:DNA-nicking Smr family endonuclease
MGSSEIMARKRKAKPASGPRVRRFLGPEPEEELDLHGMAVDEALAAVDVLLTAYRGKAGILLRLIHGHSNRGPDSIRVRLHQNLATVWKRRVARYRLDFHNHGATLIETSGA